MHLEMLPVQTLSGFSPEHLGVRAPYALHYEPHALILALRFIYVALRVVRVWYVRKKSAYACDIHNTTLMRSSSVALSGLIFGRLHSRDFTDFRKHVKISLVFRIHFSDFGFQAVISRFHAVISRFRKDSL